MECGSRSTAGVPSSNSLPTRSAAVKSSGYPLSPESADTFAIMKKVKQMFDPDSLLNRSRLYGRI